MVKITKRVVEAADAREKDYLIWDDELPGFGLRVFSSGKRSYVIHEFKQTAYALDRDSRKAAPGSLPEAGLGGRLRGRRRGAPLGCLVGRGFTTRSRHILHAPQTRRWPFCYR